MKKLSFEREEFYIVFEESPKVWEIFYKITKWCDSYVNFHLNTLEINKNWVHYFLGIHKFLEDVKWIYVAINKPLHRIKGEEEQIKLFKEFIKRKFKKSKPTFVKELPKRFKDEKN